MNPLTAGALVDEPDVPTCRLCGCTDYAACLGGCWWVDDPERIGELCSQCLDLITGGGA